MLFNGNGTDGLDSLWKTSGTAATTSEITGIAGPAAAAGLDPSDLTVVNGKVLFNGNDSRSNTAGRAVSDCGKRTEPAPARLSSRGLE